MYTLYVIPGSHACRSAMLMLEHKQVGYRQVRLITLLHPGLARAHGFTSGGETRTVGTRRPIAVRIADQLATVPGLAFEAERISTNRGIARFLEDRHPDPPLFPTEPGQRAAVEEVERWASTELQMYARRLVTAMVRRDPSTSRRVCGDGRLGHLLYKHSLTRRVFLPTLVAGVFAPNAATERKLLGHLPATLDRIDRWIASGVLDGPRLNVADFMVAPSLALILYRPDALPVFAGRPSLQFVNRLLPPPRGSGSG